MHPSVISHTLLALWAGSLLITAEGVPASGAKPVVEDLAGLSQAKALERLQAGRAIKGSAHRLAQRGWVEAAVYPVAHPRYTHLRVERSFPAHPTVQDIQPVATAIVVADELLVTLRQPVDALAQLERAGVKVRKHLGGNVYLVGVGQAVAHPDALDEAAARLADLGTVDRNELVFAEADPVVPNDPNLRLQWALGSTPSLGIQPQRAWALTTGSRQVVVAVIDTGIDLDHPDLVPNLWTNPGESGRDAQGRDRATNGQDDDGNGFVDDVHGYDFFGEDNLPSDDATAHGTHVAGIIGAAGNNQTGVCGINWQISILPVRAVGGSTADVLQSLRYIRDLKTRYGLNLIATSNSYSFSTFHAGIYDELVRHGQAGILACASAGNSGTNNDAWLNNFPATYDLPNVIAVAASDYRDLPAGFSNFGRTTVDVFAPGENIYSTIVDGYGYKSGTSMASPQVAGAVALIASYRPTLAAADIKNLLLQHARPSPELAEKCATGGILDLGSAMASLATARPSVTFTVAAQALPEAVGTATITARLSAPTNVAVGIPFTLSGTATNGVDYTIGASPLTIAAGADTASITIAVVNDTMVEDTETLIVTMGTPTNAIAGGHVVQTLSILNDDVPPTVTFTAAVQSRAENAGTATITALLSRPIDKPVSLPFALSGTATNRVDYTIGASPLVIPAGATAATITVTILDDAVLEQDETLIVTMGTPTNATKGATRIHRLTIVDDATVAPLPVVTFTAAAQSQAENAGSATITAQLSAPSAVAVSVPFELSGTATAGTDYAISASELTIPAGATSASITIGIIDDAVAEADETVIVTMGSPIQATQGAMTAHTLTIANDDVDARDFALSITAQHGRVVCTPDAPIYAAGTRVQLRPIPDPGYAFRSFAGDLSSTWSSAQVIVMDAAKAVTATFARIDLVCADAVIVDEGASVTVPIRLSRRPSEAVTVHLAWDAADPSLGMTPGTVTILPENWNHPVAVTVSAAQDGDSICGTGVIRLDAAGYDQRLMVVAIQDDDGNQALQVGTRQLSVPEARSVQLGVGITGLTGTAAVQLGMLGGDPSITVPASVTIGSGTTRIAIAAAADQDDTRNGSAILALASDGLTQRLVLVNEVDDDVALTTNYHGGRIDRAPDAAVYQRGTAVQLTAVPLPGFTFTGWSGALGGTTNPTSLTLAGHAYVRATFVKSVDPTDLVTDADLTAEADGDAGPDMPWPGITLPDRHDQGQADQTQSAAGGSGGGCGAGSIAGLFCGLAALAGLRRRR